MSTLCSEPCSLQHRLSLLPQVPRVLKFPVRCPCGSFRTRERSTQSRRQRVSSPPRRRRCARTCGSLAGRPSPRSCSSCCCFSTRCTGGGTLAAAAASRRAPWACRSSARRCSSSPPTPPSTSLASSATGWRGTRTPHFGPRRPD
jgi:hypothetical protein